MPMVIITCPTTGKPVPTGIVMDERAFETSTLVNNSVTCPHCKQRHTWNKKDARLETTN